MVHVHLRFRGFRKKSEKLKENSIIALYGHVLWAEELKGTYC